MASVVMTVVMTVVLVVKMATNHLTPYSRLVGSDKTGQ